MPVYLGSDRNISCQVDCLISFQAMQRALVWPHPHISQGFDEAAALNIWLSRQCSQTPPTIVSPDITAVIVLAWPATSSVTGPSSLGTVIMVVSVPVAFLSVPSARAWPPRPPATKVSARHPSPILNSAFILLSSGGHSCRPP